MSTRSRCMVLLVLACLLAAPALLQSQSAAALFEQALLKENAEGSLSEAIAIFSRIAGDKAADPAIRARAQLHVGICHEKLGNAQAREAYEQLIANFPQQTSEVAAARARLAALAAPAREASTLPALRLVARITRANAPPSGSISPDGRLLAYVNWDTGDVAVRDLRTGQSRMVTNKGGNWETADFGFMPRWSPDGKRLAYYWYRGEGALDELRITDLSGKNTRVLYSQRYGDGRGLSPVGWYPDATALLAVSLHQAYATEIMRVSVEEGRITPLAKPASTGSSRVCLSPNGRYVAFDMPPDSGSLNMDVFVMPSSGGRAVAVVTGPYDDRLLDWTPDGRRILVASNRSGTYDAFFIDLDDGAAAGSPQLLRKDLGLVTPLGFAPDGAFHFVPDVAVDDVMVVDWSPESQKATSEPRLATEHFSGATRLPAWSPDGRKLAYLVDRGHYRAEPRVVRVRDAETGAERTLVESNGSVYSLSWSPDATSVAVTARGEGPNRTILCRILDANSGKVIREITSPRRGISRFQWAPDGSVAYYNAIDADSTVLLRRDLSTADETLLYTGTANAPMSFAVSPDGRHVAVGDWRGILVIPTSGGEARELVRLDPPGGRTSGLAWSRDGSSLYFTRRLKRGIWLHRVAVGGGAPENLNFEVGEELCFSQDGRHLAFTRLKGQTVAEVWVMENFLPPVK